MEFKDRLAARRKELRLTQEKVAELCGYATQSRISNYERGDREPEFSDLKKLTKALDWTVGQMFGEEPGRSQEMQLDLPTLQTAIVTAKEAAKRLDVEFEAFAAAPLILFAIRERKRLPRFPTKAQLAAFDRDVLNELREGIENERTERSAEAGGARIAETAAPVAKKARARR